MDPNALWRDLSQAIADNEWSLAGELAESLKKWLQSGGFPPRVTGVAEFDRIVTRSTAEAIACWDVA
jgi:hypothetical protein